MGLELGRRIDQPITRLIIFRRGRKLASKRTSSLIEPARFKRRQQRDGAASLLKINLPPMYAPFGHSTGKLTFTFIFKVQRDRRTAKEIKHLDGPIGNDGTKRMRNFSPLSTKFSPALCRRPESKVAPFEFSQVRTSSNTNSIVNNNDYRQAGPDVSLPAG